MDNNNNNITLYNRLATEPTDRDLLLDILDFCKEGRTIDEISDFVSKYNEFNFSLRSAVTLLAWLFEDGGIEKKHNKKTELWFTTREGADALSQIRPQNALMNMINDNFEQKAIFLRILRMCTEGEDKSTIEEAFAGISAFDNNEISVSYFIGLLEEADGLKWCGKWQVTETGRKLVNSIAI